MKIGMLFAGQGSQKVGMGLDLYDSNETFRKVFDLLPAEQKAIAWNGPEEVLTDTRNTQPIMVAFALGIYRCLEEAGIRPEMAAGLSLGEYSALGAAGVLDDATAIRLVSRRALEMEKAGRGIECGMTAIMGGDREMVASCCEDASDEGLVQVANYNCPGQIVIAGEKKAVDKAAELAAERGARRCMALAISGPFHTRFMEPAGEVLENVFKVTRFGQPEFPVIHNATGRPPAEGETIPELLIRQVSGSVHFEETIRYMIDQGVDTIIEIGPGKALSGFVRKTDRSIPCHVIETAEDLEKVIQAVGPEAGNVTEQAVKGEA